MRHTSSLRRPLATRSSPASAARPEHEGTLPASPFHPSWIAIEIVSFNFESAVIGDLHYVRISDTGESAGVGATGGARLIALCSRVAADGERTSRRMKRPPGRLILFWRREPPVPNIAIHPACSDPGTAGVPYF
jgi:hypothetical protein